MSFDPYEDNGGTALAISGKGFCIIASDLRQSSGYLINTRQSSKIHNIGKKVVLAGSGFSADVHHVAKELLRESQRYQFSHQKEISCQSLAQFTMSLLYSRRFFPLYSFNLICGLDESGDGAIYKFDPVGSFERESYRAIGSGASLIQPLLDNLVGFKNRTEAKRELTKEEALQLCKDALNSATERDIHTGDGAEVYVLTPEGISVERYPLRED